MDDPAAPAADLSLQATGPRVVDDNSIRSGDTPAADALGRPFNHLAWSGDHAPRHYDRQVVVVIICSLLGAALLLTALYLLLDAADW